MIKKLNNNVQLGAVDSEHRRKLNEIVAELNRLGSVVDRNVKDILDNPLVTSLPDDDVKPRMSFQDKWATLAWAFSDAQSDVLKSWLKWMQDELKDEWLGGVSLPPDHVVVYKADVEPKDTHTATKEFRDAIEEGLKQSADGHAQYLGSFAEHMTQLDRIENKISGLLKRFCGEQDDDN